MLDLEKRARDRPNLAPLLRTVATAPATTDEILDYVRDCIGSSADPDFTRAYVHAVLFDAWMEGESAGGGIRPGLSTEQYGWLVEGCGFERYLIQCLSLPTWNVYERDRKMLELSRLRPRLAAILFCWLDLPGLAESKAHDWDWNEEGRVLELYVELLQCCRDDALLKTPDFTKRVAELLLVLLQEACPQESSINLTKILLQHVGERANKAAKEEDSPDHRELLRWIAGFTNRKEAASGEGPSLDVDARSALEKLRAAAKSSEFFGWPSPALGRDLDDASFLSAWMSLSGGNHCGPSTSTVDRDLDRTVNELAGWVMGQFPDLCSFSDVDLLPEIAQPVTTMLLQMLIERTLLPDPLFSPLLALLYSHLSQFRTRQSQQSLLQLLGHAHQYQQFILCLENRQDLAKVAVQRITCLTNQLMECGKVHEGIVSDKEHSQQHLNAWIGRIFPLCVLFPSLAMRHFTRNAVLYEAQQRQLVETLKFFGPISQGIWSLCLLHLYEMVSELDALLPENLCSFVQQYLKEETLSEKSCFLEKICAEFASGFEAPTPTVEGLMRAAAIVLEQSHDERGLVPACLHLSPSLKPIQEFSRVPGNAAHVAHQGFIQASELLFERCVETLIASATEVTREQFSGLMEQWQSEDWHLRIRYVELTSAMNRPDPQSAEFTAHFQPDAVMEATETGSSAIAQAWAQYLSQLLWFGSLSEACCTVLCSELRGPAVTDAPSLISKVAQSLAREAKRLPEELQSWSLVMAVANLTMTASASCIDRLLSRILPSYLQHISVGSSSDDDLATLNVEVFCRALYVIGAHPELAEDIKGQILNQGQVQLAHFCIEELEEGIQSTKQELFTLRTFSEITSLASSMESAFFDSTELQMLLSHFLHRLVCSARHEAQGWVLLSGISLHLVLEWITSWIQNLKPSVQNVLIFRMNKLIKDNLEHL